MAVVVLKKRNIRILVICILLLGLTFTVLRSSSSNIASSSPFASEGNRNKDITPDQALVDYDSVEDPAKVRPGQVGKFEGDDDGTTQYADGEYNPAVHYNALLKANPLIMFSKTFCPYSGGLKELLAEYFEFTPSILIVELDQDPNGRELQEYIEKKTGRGTVPNLIVNGISRGGFDDLQELYRMTALFDSFESWSDGKYTIVKKKEKPDVNNDIPLDAQPEDTVAAAAAAIGGAAAVAPVDGAPVVAGPAA